ncbi:3-octaprenyl-4-hydroxybenzoate carboxy-lyase [Rhodoblastus sphagnicola]|uniref:3-octaprenyl-4-hydroxybenzoate carboxy-lyase n=1 Tax=Rhodoblastus sphagnicola TaxID=333368 RepID=A0A2S6NBB2_9HYPH|nr:UbiD family decarboxylase [Rhodoblastus sphagnicola]MBB4197755.1 4-hydroxy-3-polyprenylbenzoate decarboxylase [Rhodoblastus sphagnicola]PPQ31899.1 3-octaprenyl-4-hydroxybenzoate carboxy-lyase [Rhodoblastus sphagnicola]
MTFRELPPFRDLRAFAKYLEQERLLARVGEKVSLVHEMTELHRRVLVAGGPALLFEKAVSPRGPATMPVLTNLFGTQERVAAGFGVALSRIGELGEMLAALREPAPVDGFKDAMSRWPMVRAALSTRQQVISKPPCQAEVFKGDDVDLGKIPVQTCWPGEPAPLITWPLVITRPPDTDADETARMNIGVYRMQVLGKDKAIMRWLAHRGGAAHHRAWARRGEDMPVAIAIGVDPATILSAVLPLPETVSELRFSGVIRGERPHVAQALTVPIMVPADAEIIIEGYVSATETAPEGPYGDHTGYYNSVEQFPVLRITAITTRRDPIYLSTFTARPPDEPSVIGSVLNDLALPTMRRQLPEIVDVWLPPEACSYRMAIVSIRKTYPGQARRVMMGLWGMLPQFSYTKTVIVVDEDINGRDWNDVAWALATRMDPSRDLTIIRDTPIDYLDFASPESGLGGKLGIDATNKIGAETHREWGTKLDTSEEIKRRVDALLPQVMAGFKRDGLR